MSNVNRTSSGSEWTSGQAYAMAVVCLLLGIAGGWLFRGSQSPAIPESASAATPASASEGAAPSAAQMKKMAEAQAAPLLAQLQSNPNDPDLLARIGNVYYDTNDFATAIDYYQRSLKLQPARATVRTDMATAYWYSGDATTAIDQFNQALKYEPNNPNALFNLGVVKWQGKMDIDGAVAVWKQLLDTNPNFEGKAKVQDLIAQAQKHSGIKPGTAAKSLP